MPAQHTGSPAEKAVRGAASGLLPVCVFAVVAVAATSCMSDSRSSGPEHDDPAAWAWNAPISAPSTVFIRNTNGSITVKPATGGNVEVTADMKWRRGDPKHDITFKTVNTSSGVIVCAVWNDGTCSEGKYETKKPGFSFGPFSQGTDASVNFTVYVPTGVKVDLLTINGSIGAALTAPVKARTVNGTIKVATAVGPVDAETVNGSVDVRMTTLSGDGPVRAHAVTGSVAAYLPQKFDGSVDLESVIGNVSSDFPGNTSPDDKKKFTATVGAGTRTVDIGTVTGSAALHKLNADGTVAAP
ncbi:MAG TPA: DUF4097 family beta strand repeat-containing protein [Gemmatimonadaceae bacterium]|nr:DUF4097 family beta strand repeat-containing protein [Gemmatimonadaceae bacterium]